MRPILISVWVFNIMYLFTPGNVCAVPVERIQYGRWRDIISTVEGYFQYSVGFLVRWRGKVSTNYGTKEEVQYGKDFLSCRGRWGQSSIAPATLLPNLERRGKAGLY